MSKPELNKIQTILGRRPFLKLRYELQTEIIENHQRQILNHKRALLKMKAQREETIKELRELEGTL